LYKVKTLEQWRRKRFIGGWWILCSRKRRMLALQICKLAAGSVTGFSVRASNGIVAFNSKTVSANYTIASGDSAIAPEAGLWLLA